VGEQRLIKLCFEGANLTLLIRWVPTGSDWRIAVLEPVSASAARPA
jgi:hypothetical protein